MLARLNSQPYSLLVIVTLTTAWKSGGEEILWQMGDDCRPSIDPHISGRGCKNNPAPSSFGPWSGILVGYDAVAGSGGPNGARLVGTGRRYGIVDHRETETRLMPAGLATGFRRAAGNAASAFVLGFPGTPEYASQLPQGYEGIAGTMLKAGNICRVAAPSNTPIKPRPYCAPSSEQF